MLRRFARVASRRSFQHLNRFEFKPVYPELLRYHPHQKTSLNALHRLFSIVTPDLASLGQIPILKKSLSFTCNKCDTHNHRIISKQAYEKGVVIVRCDGCDNLHLIADNLDWFQNPNGRNVEQILAAKGEKVITDGDLIEFDSKNEAITNRNDN